MEPHVNVIGSLDQFIRQAGSAARTERDSRFTKGSVDGFVPPRAMPEFDNVSPLWVELSHDALKPSTRKMKTRRQLEEETSHAWAQNVCDQAEVADESLGALESLRMRDQFRDLDRVDEVTPPSLPNPCSNRGNGGP